MNGYFVLFNNVYVKWARAAIQTFLDWHPDWKVEAFVVNTVHDKISGGVFNDERVNITFIETPYPRTLEKEKMFCNSKRFCVFAQHAKKYKKIVTTDVDILFTKRLTEIERELNKNELCMYVDHNATPKDKAGASFLAYRPTRRMMKFWERYEQILDSKRPFWWNDQISLYETYCEMQTELKAFLFPYEKYCFSGLDEAGLRKCEVIQPRGPKDSNALTAYRNMVDDILGTKVKMNVLVLGSGISGEAVKDIDLSNHYVLAINNAWRLTPFWTHHLFPDDFEGPFPTKLNQIQQKIDNTIYMKANLKWGGLEWRGNSMIYNALFFALNFEPDVIGTLGCDLYYPESGPTHFYEGGTNDPMRFHEDYHKERFKRFLETCEKKKIKCVNYSNESRGLNPFPHEKFPYVLR
jgi:hypothetical protein